MLANQATDQQITSVLPELYDNLTSFVKRRVYDVNVQSWSGQEYDLIQDIVQESVVRTYFQMRKAECGDVPLIISPHYFGKRVARNHLFDVVRKEARLVRPSIDGVLHDRMVMEQWLDSCEDVLDDMETVSLFALIARAIADVPNKQRKALLIDLAELTPIDEPFRPLPQALMSVNINLDMYRNLVPTGIVEKQRHASLLSQAYKRVKITVLDHLRSHGGDCSA